jgi:hypothetical protein
VTAQATSEAPEIETGLEIYNRTRRGAIALADKIGSEFGLSPTQVEVLRRTVCKELSDDELLLVLTRCGRLGIDPFSQVSVWKQDGRVVMQVRIDGLRALALKTGRFKGRKLELIPHPERQGEIIGARCTIWRKDIEEPFVAEAILAEFRQPNSFSWQKMPETMIKKVAEAHALRAAFPLMAQLYEPAELDHAKE